MLRGEITLTKKLKELYCGNVRIVIIDATTGDDIQQIAQAVQKAKFPVLRRPCVHRAAGMVKIFIRAQTDQ